MSEHKDYIQEQIPLEVLLCQLAEEAAELGQAALKLFRIIDGRNPTPVTFIEGYEKLQEEIADVQLCLKMIDIDPNHWTYHDRMDAKSERWAHRIQEDRQKNRKDSP